MLSGGSEGIYNYSWSWEEQEMLIVRLTAAKHVNYYHSLPFSLCKNCGPDHRPVTSFCQLLCGTWLLPVDQKCLHTFRGIQLRNSWYRLSYCDMDLSLLEDIIVCILKFQPTIHRWLLRDPKNVFEENKPVFLGLN